MSRSKTTTTDKKRNGLHKKHTHSYAKVYWPYLPMLVLLLIVMVMGTAQPKQISNVLGFASTIDQKSLLEATNSQRVKQGESELRLNEALSFAAQAKADDMRARNYWSHETPDGEQPWIFIDNTDYAYQKAGENLAYGFLSSNATVAGWMNSPSHRQNMLDQGYTDVGFGIVNAPNYLGIEDQTIIVAFYATPAALAVVDDTVTSEVASRQSNTSLANSTTTGRFTASTATPFISALTNGKNLWLTFVVGATTGIAATTLLIRHGLRLKRMIHTGEVFIMHHPVFDLSFTAIVVIGVILSQSVGFIN